MFLPHFDVFGDLLLNRRAARWNLFVLYNEETKDDTKRFLFQNLSSKQGKKIDVIYCLRKMKQSRWLLCVAMNYDWSKKITPLSNFIDPGMETYIKSRIELQNLQILKKMLEMSSQFLSSERLCEPKTELGRRLEYRRSSKIR